MSSNDGIENYRKQERWYAVDGKMSLELHDSNKSEDFFK